MTIKIYTPDKLDQLALRLFDVAADIRSMAKRLNQSELDDIPLNDKKAMLLLDEMEMWALKSKSKIEIHLRKIDK